MEIMKSPMVKTEDILHHILDGDYELVSLSEDPTKGVKL